MTRAYDVVDADGHILEPLDLWDNYIDPKFRERRPRFTMDENGKERLKVEGKLLGNPRGIGSLGSVGVRQGAVKPDTLKYAEGKKGGFDHQDGFFPGAPQMLRDRPGPLSVEAKHQVLAGGAMGFYALS